MTPERWQRIQTLFDAALLRDAVKRADYLRQACGDDTPLRDEVEELLAAHAEASAVGLLAGPVTGLPLDDAPPSLTGRRLGPYELGPCIGSGGMGSVYRAVRVDDYRQIVAVKVIRAGVADTEFIDRFRRERQALAELSHPHIARLLDGGTADDGSPYLVMEFVDGRPLDRHSAAAGLPVREQVRLVRGVAEAVHHAHGRGILHRDLKPGNVLVAADGTPRVVDFGLARLAPAADHATAAGQTQTGQVLGTPSYMAPEQAAGRPREVGPATDVWALGAILYELFTGRPPFRGDGVYETIRQVLEDEPVAPRLLAPGLPRDLETIALKCLHKDPVRRYPTAAALADDLGRFLDGQPIQARPASAWERGRAWVRRRPTAAALLAATVLLTVVSLVYAALLARKAEEARTQRDQARRALGSHAEALAAIAQVAAQNPTSEAVENLRRSIASFEALAADDLSDPQFRSELAAVCVSLGTLYHRTGRQPEAGAAHRRALALYEAMAREHGESPRLLAGRATVHRFLADVHASEGSAARAEEALAQAVELTERLRREEPGEPRHGVELAEAQFQLGRLFDQLNQRDEAESSFQRARDAYRRSAALFEELLGAEPGRPEYRHLLGRALFHLGDLFAARGRPDEARPIIRQAVDLRGRLAADHPDRTEYQVGAALTYALQSRFTFYLEGKHDEALTWAEKAIPVLADAVRTRPLDADARRALAHAYGVRGVIQDNRKNGVLALLDADRKLQLQPPAIRGDLDRMMFAYQLATLGEHGPAAAEVEPIAARPGLDGRVALNLAYTYGVAAAAARRDARLSSAEREQAADRLGAVGVRLLRHLHNQGGFRDPQARQNLHNDPDLTALRDRSDFKALLHDLKQTYQEARP